MTVEVRCPRCGAVRAVLPTGARPLPTFGTAVKEAGGVCGCGREDHGRSSGAVPSAGAPADPPDTGTPTASPQVHSGQVSGDTTQR